MRHSIRLVAGIVLAAATLAGCDGGGGGQSMVSSGGAPPPTTPSPPGGAGGDGGSGGSGGGSASLNTTRFRTLTVSVTPTNGGTVSDNFEDHGSAIQQCTACSERYQIGTRVVLTARAAPGFRFDRWQGSVCEGSVSPTCALVMEQATGMTAVFRR